MATYQIDYTDDGDMPDESLAEIVFGDKPETFDNMDLRTAAEYYQHLYTESNAAHMETVAKLQAAEARAEAVEANIVEMNKVIELLQSQRDRTREDVKRLRETLENVNELAEPQPLDGITGYANLTGHLNNVLNEIERLAKTALK